MELGTSSLGNFVSTERRNDRLSYTKEVGDRYQAAGNHYRALHSAGLAWLDIRPQFRPLGCRFDTFGVKGGLRVHMSLSKLQAFHHQEPDDAIYSTGDTPITFLPLALGSPGLRGEDDTLFYVMVHRP
jgi:hypothetical protein